MGLSVKFLSRLGFGNSDDSHDHSCQAKADELEARNLTGSSYKLLDAGEVFAARTLFKKALKLDPESADAHRGLALTYSATNELDKAIRELTKAISIRPSFADAHNDLGIIYDKKGNFPAAAKSFVQALRFRSNSSEIRNNLALAYFNIGSYGEAMKAYKQSLATDPHDSCALYGLARVYMDLNEKELALKQHAIILKMGEKEIAAQLLDEIQRQKWQSQYSYS